MRQVCDVGGDVDTVACVTGGLAGGWFGVQSIPSRWVTHVHGRVGDTAYRNADLRVLAARLIGRRLSPMAPDVAPRGPVQIRPGVFAANILGAVATPADHAVLSLCRVGDRFADRANRREFFLIDQPGANPGLAAVIADAVAEIDAFRAADIPVVVHCHAGESRTGLVLRSWLMHHDGVDAETAAAELSSRWPHLTRVNDDFEALLAAG